MTEEIIIDGGRMAGIKTLRSKLKRLEQENEMLTRENENRNDWITSLNKKCEELIKEKLKYSSALEEIKHGIMHIPPFNKQSAQMIEALLKLINEVLK